MLDPKGKLKGGDHHTPSQKLQENEPEITINSGEPLMPVLSKKASNVVTSVSNSNATVVVTSPSFDGEATVHVSYPKKDLTEIVYALDAEAGEAILMGQPVHQDSSDSKLYVANSVNKVNVVGIAMTDANAGDNLEYGALGMLELTDWNPITSLGTDLVAGDKYFLRADGTIQNAPPTTGWLLQIGQASTTKAINIEIGSTPIKL